MVPSVGNVSRGILHSTSVVYILVSIRDHKKVPDNNFGFSHLVNACSYSFALESSRMHRFVRVLMVENVLGVGLW